MAGGALCFCAGFSGEAFESFCLEKKHSIVYSSRKSQPLSYWWGRKVRSESPDTGSKNALSAFAFLQEKFEKSQDKVTKNLISGVWHCLWASEVSLFILQNAFQVPNDLYKSAIHPKLRNQQNKILGKKEENLVVH